MKNGRSEEVLTEVVRFFDPDDPQLETDGGGGAEDVADDDNDSLEQSKISICSTGGAASWRNGNDVK
jgi:hypothetical protein